MLEWGLRRAYKGTTGEEERVGRRVNAELSVCVGGVSWDWPPPQRGREKEAPFPYPLFFSADSRSLSFPRDITYLAGRKEMESEGFS